MNDISKRLSTQKMLPMLICNVGELITINDEETNELYNGVVIKTSGRTNVFCQTSGMVPYNQIKPGDLIAVNKDSFLIYEKLPQFYDARVKAMRAEKPKDTFRDVGGMDEILKQV